MKNGPPCCYGHYNAMAADMVIVGITITITIVPKPY